MSIKYRWNAVARRYVDADGAEVSPENVRAALDDSVDDAALLLLLLTTRLRPGASKPIDLPGWRDGMDAGIRGVHGLAAGLAVGGWARLDGAARAAAEGRVAGQLSFLDAFAGDLADGAVEGAAAEARAASYARAATGTFEAVNRAGSVAAGFAEERRHLNSEKSCDQCPGYAGQGWVPIGTLPGIGESCSCGSKCACSFAYRRIPAQVAPPMPLDHAALKLDPARCERTRRAAARLGVNAAPIRLYATEPPATAIKPTSAKGTLPEILPGNRPGPALLERIRSMQPAGAVPLAADQLYCHLMEAGNTAYIADRSMFLAESTLRNVAARAGSPRGFSLMNSHRTGGACAPAELPYGRIAAGRFERYAGGDARASARTMLIAYLVSGQRPNGPNGMTSDDLHAAIMAGVVSEVSLGLSGGTARCDVCGLALSFDESGETDCGHLPGTHLGMDGDQKAAQVARGVPGGYGSYTLEDAEPAEVSAVYAGAVPGAGFARAVRLARAGRLPAPDRARARRFYAEFLPKHAPGRPAIVTTPAPLTPTPGSRPMNPTQIREALTAAGLSPEMLLAALQAPAAPAAATPAKAPAPAEALAHAPAPAGPAPAPPANLAAETQTLLARLETVEAANRALSESARITADAAQARELAAGAARFAQECRGKILPSGAPHLASLHLQAARDDAADAAARLAAGRPAEGAPGRRAALEAFVAALPGHNLAHEIIPTAPHSAQAVAHASHLPAVPGMAVALAQDIGGEPMTEEARLADLRRCLATSPAGRAALMNERDGKLDLRNVLQPA